MKQIARKYKPLYNILLHGVTSPCLGYSFDKQVCIDRIMQFSDNKAELVSSMSGEYSGVDKYEWKVKDWLYDKFYDYTHISDYGDYTTLEADFETFAEMMDDFNKKMEG